MFIDEKSTDKDHRVALTRLVDRRAMLPSVIEMRFAKCAQMRTAVCTKGAKLT